VRPEGKSVHSGRTKKHPQRANFSAPTERAKKHPHIVFHVECAGGVGLVGYGGENVLTLQEKLIFAGQTPWTTPTRLSCLSLIISHIETAAKKSKDTKARGIPFSNRLARQFCSQLRTAPDGVAREPLAALVKAGLIEQSSPAKASQFSKRSARYRLTPEGRRIQATLKTSPLAVGAQRKRDAAPERLEKGLNRRWPFREQLLRDLAVLTLAPSQMARETAAALLKDKDVRASTKAVLHVLSTREHTARVQPSGQITTSLNSCPKLLKPHLCIDGEPVTLCDVSSAHWAFLPRLVSNRIDYRRRRGDDEGTLAPLKGELERLIELCSSGSFYESTLWKGATAADIKSRKNLLNILLNSPRSKSATNCVWRSLRRQFPLCVSIIDSIKRDDHRAISRQLQHFTAAAITAALIEMQAEGLPAIPDTDCLIVRERDHAAACAAIGQAMHNETAGVCVTVGGIHYSPEIRSKPSPTKEPETIREEPTANGKHRGFLKPKRPKSYRNHRWNTSH
jgi:DNA-binding MarR family transcriptional regulator